MTKPTNVDPKGENPTTEMMIDSRLSALAFFFLASGAVAFISVPTRRPQPPCFSSNNPDNDEIDNVRRMLETSWNTKTMGLVPDSPEAAARAAADSLETAMERSSQNCYFIDIRLPQYDSSNLRLYDEVLGVEFCIALSQCLHAQTQILVRDAKVLRTVERLQKARGETNDSNRPVSSVDNVETSEKEEEEEEDTAPVVADGDLEDFRKTLMASWDAAPDTVAQPPPPEPRMPPPDAKSPIDTESYRLASLLGEDASQFSANMDTMMKEVVSKVKEFALPRPEEDLMILLSPSSREELVAVRALASKYPDKTMVVVNSNLDPVPREWLQADVVYSIMPLKAQAKEDPDDSEKASVVLLRRYPRDWELYVDVLERGFDLVASTVAKKGNNKGPDFDWIVLTVEKYLNSFDLGR